MPAADNDIDRLYQLPLDEFTPARNALAKQSGDATVKSLQKPNIAAWAINQLYWTRRRDYDRIVAAATKLRDAHLSMLTGRSADVPAAERDHAAAVRGGSDAIREILRQAGEAESQATLTAVQDTLNALPADDLPGRLTRPLKPKGFEALLGLVTSGTAIARKPSPASAPPASARAATVAPSKREVEAEKKAAEARRRDAAETAEALREAKAAARKAATAVDHAKAQHGRALETQRELQEQLEAIETRIRELAGEIRRLEKEASAAASQVDRLELRQAQLGAVK
jgi:DNA repair exonuclease SbcCD ATPase subunit